MKVSQLMNSALGWFGLRLQRVKSSAGLNRYDKEIREIISFVKPYTR
jgi:hypothetical protein